MKCEDIRLLINEDDYSHSAEKSKNLQRSSDISASAVKIEGHLQHCIACQQMVRLHSQLRDQLRAVPRAKASVALQQRILSARAPAEYPTTALESATKKLRTDSLVVESKTSNTQRKYYFGIAASVSLLVLALVVSDQLGNQVTMPTRIAATGDASIATQSSISAQVNKPRQINFLVDSAELIEDVTFTLSVPPQMALYGYNGQQTLSWQGRLKPGKNLLSVPVMALREKSGFLIMKITHQGSMREYKVAVNVQQNRVMAPIWTNGHIS
ncbi:MAG: hypothetical protein ACC707_08720 [Thiohalomonadales bacterium]